MGKGSHRFRAFRLSKIMPNSWFYKLRDMGGRRSRKVQKSNEKAQVPIMETGKSFEIQKPIPEPPQKQAYIRNRPSYYIPSRNRVEKGTETQLSLNKPRKTNTNPPNKLISSSASSVNTSQEQSFSVLCSEPPHETPMRHIDGYNLRIRLPPIATKPIKKETNKPNLAMGNQSSKHGSFSSHGSMRRSCTPQTPRIKIRLKSPKAAKKRLRERKGLADSVVVVKLSSDPQSDFRESMKEMIFQNNLWASKDLEELLSCYLYLNSEEYHPLIVKAFKQIWFDLTVMNLH